MAPLSNFFSQKSRTPDTGETPTLSPQIAQEIAQMYQEEVESIRALQQRTLYYQIGDPTNDPKASRLGGRGSWPTSKPLTASGEGDPTWIFVAQWNFKDLDGHFDVPDGILQFYVAQTPHFGCHFPSIHRDGFFIAHHTAQECDTLDWLDPIEGDTFFTYPDAHATSLHLHLHSRGNMPPTLDDFRIGEKMHRAVKLAQQNSSAPYDHQILRDLDKDIERMARAQRTTPVHFGGHPHFTQSDFRHTHWQDKTFPLLSLSHCPQFCIGDAGELHILISPQDFEAQNFEGAVYNWDCY